ncbi:MAG TPA: ATP-binding cassette domain-containing protein [Thermoanaerobaculia bacterium]|nr:ATP-binding cassette domain-containing protein [Thermoanaerobaculia bacterium]
MPAARRPPDVPRDADLVDSAPPPEAGATARLAFRDLSRRFGRLSVLRGVSGAAGAGEVLVVTGANGSGKSTLLRCLAGLLAPDAGSIEYREDGGAVLAADERRRRVGYVAPDLALYEELTGAENLAFFARLRGVDRARGGLLLDRLGLPRDRAVGALSSGMRQKLRWAWALLHHPRLLLLDEPFQNLDAGGEAVVRDLLAEHLAGERAGGPAGLAVLAQPVDPDLDPRWKVGARVELAG